jgi:hypothetical protein
MTAPVSDLPLSLSPALPPAPTGPGLKLTFGVEFECVFAFHESLLTDHLKSIDAGTVIVKDLTDEMRRDFRRCHTDYLFSRPMYMGWALTSDVPTLASGEMTPTGNRLQKYGCRPYADEILHVALPLLPPNTDFQSLVYDGKRTTFSQWHVCEDTSIMGVDQKTLLAELGDRIDAVGNWDSHGLELVSRILEPSPAAFQEIATYLSALRGTSASRHGALISNHTGMHVQVGLPPSPDARPGQALPSFDLATIQHLSYLLVMYEAEFSSLHPVSRREGPDVASNLDDFYGDMESRMTYDDVWDEELDGPRDEEAEATPPPAEEAEEPYYGLSFSRAREMIFAPGMTMAKLVKMMCGSTRTHIVNFQYLLRDEHLARTIEFRQHAGCLRDDDVRHWVELLVKLVTKAYTMSQTVGVVVGGDEGWNGEGYPNLEDKRNGGGVEELMAVLEVDEEARGYWVKRSEEFAE